MSATTNCHPLPRDLAKELMQDAIRAICPRPGEDKVRCESRIRQLAHFTVGFEPRDGLEYILSTLAFAHFDLILDSFRDVFHAQKDGSKARSIKTILGLDRALMGMLREYRLQRKRPVAPDEAATVTPAPPVENAAAAPPPSPNAPAPKPPEPARPEIRPEASQPRPVPGAPAVVDALDNLIAVLENVPKPDAGDAAWVAHSKAYEDAFDRATQSGAFDKAKRLILGRD